MRRHPLANLREQVERLRCERDAAYRRMRQAEIELARRDRELKDAKAQLAAGAECLATTT